MSVGTVGSGEGLRNAMVDRLVTDHAAKGLSLWGSRATSPLVGSIYLDNYWRIWHALSHFLSLRLQFVKPKPIVLPIEF